MVSIATLRLAWKVTISALDKITIRYLYRNLDAVTSRHLKDRGTHRCADIRPPSNRCRDTTLIADISHHLIDV